MVTQCQFFNQGALTRGSVRLKFWAELTGHFSSVLGECLEVRCSKLNVLVSAHSWLGFKVDSVLFKGAVECLFEWK